MQNNIRTSEITPTLSNRPIAQLIFTCDHVTRDGYRKTQLHSKDVPMDHNRLYFLETTCLIQKEAGKVECCDIDLNHICCLINPAFYNSSCFESMVRLRKLPRLGWTHAPCCCVVHGLKFMTHLGSASQGIIFKGMKFLFTN